jgi:choline monooxygenase
MSSFRDDQAVAARILAHIEARTTDTGDTVWREPVANYCSPERLRAELEVLRRAPRALCPSAAVRDAGQFATVRADGRSIVLVRERRSAASTFGNADPAHGASYHGGRGARSRCRSAAAAAMIAAASATDRTSAAVAPTRSMTTA